MSYTDPSEMEKNNHIIPHFINTNPTIDYILNFSLLGSTFLRSVLWSISENIIIFDFNLKDTVFVEHTQSSLASYCSLAVCLFLDNFFLVRCGSSAHFDLQLVAVGLR